MKKTGINVNLFFGGPDSQVYIQTDRDICINMVTLIQFDLALSWIHAQNCTKIILTLLHLLQNPILCDIKKLHLS